VEGTGDIPYINDKLFTTTLCYGVQVKSDVVITERIP